MRGIAFALAAVTFAATGSHPVAAQCYGPECDRQRADAPVYYDERSNVRSYRSNGQPPRSAPYEQVQPYRSAPHQQPQAYRSAPYEQTQPYRPAPRERAQPYRPEPYEQAQPYRSAPYDRGRPYQSTSPSQPIYREPAYQAPPRPPAGYSNVPPNTPPGVALRGGEYRTVYPDGRVEVRTLSTNKVTSKVTKISKPAKSAARQHQPATNTLAVIRSAPRTAGADQITISIAEYRELQDQARELQRLLTTSGGAPNGFSPFPDVPPPAGRLPGQSPGNKKPAP